MKLSKSKDRRLKKQSFHLQIFKKVDTNFKKDLNVSVFIIYNFEIRKRGNIQMNYTTDYP